jgi:hypothetical protein
MSDSTLALRETAARLARILGEDQCLLVGGLAVAAHGYLRATDDVDLVTQLSLQRAQQLLKEHGIATTLTSGDVLEGDFACLKGMLDGVRFDVLPQLVPLEWAGAATLVLENVGSIRIVDLEGLLRLKFRAGGPQDLMDVAFLLLYHPEQIPHARALAKAYRLGEQLESWLAHPRVRSQAEDTLLSSGAEGKKTLAALAAILSPKKPRDRER